MASLEKNTDQAPVRYVEAESLARANILSTTTDKLYGYLALLDQKASGLIILNSFIIPFAINALDDPQFQLASTISIVTSVVSIFLAIWCIIPKRSLSGIKNRKRNLLHYNDIGRMDEEEFMQEFLPIYNDTSQLAQTVIKDIHEVSKRVLIPKFRLLKLCYLSFFIGNFIAITSFLVPIWT